MATTRGAWVKGFAAANVPAADPTTTPGGGAPVTPQNGDIVHLHLHVTTNAGVLASSLADPTTQSAAWTKVDEKTNGTAGVVGIWRIVWQSAYSTSITLGALPGGASRAHTIAIHVTQGGDTSSFYDVAGAFTANAGNPTFIQAPLTGTAPAGDLILAFVGWKRGDPPVVDTANEVPAGGGSPDWSFAWAQSSATPAGAQVGASIHVFAPTAPVTNPKVQLNAPAGPAASDPYIGWITVIKSSSLAPVALTITGTAPSAAASAPSTARLAFPLRPASAPSAAAVASSSVGMRLGMRIATPAAANATAATGLSITPPGQRGARTARAVAFYAGPSPITGLVRDVVFTTQVTLQNGADIGRCVFQSPPIIDGNVKIDDAWFDITSIAPFQTTTNARGVIQYATIKSTGANIRATGTGLRLYRCDIKPAALAATITLTITGSAPSAAASASSSGLRLALRLTATSAPSANAAPPASGLTINAGQETWPTGAILDYMKYRDSKMMGTGNFQPRTICPDSQVINLQTYEIGLNNGPFRRWKVGTDPKPGFIKGPLGTAPNQYYEWGGLDGAGNPSLGLRIAGGFKIQGVDPATPLDLRQVGPICVENYEPANAGYYRTATGSALAFEDPYSPLTGISFENVKHTPSGHAFCCDGTGAIIQGTWNQIIRIKPPAVGTRFKVTLTTYGNISNSTSVHPAGFTGNPATFTTAWITSVADTNAMNAAITAAIVALDNVGQNKPNAGSTASDNVVFGYDKQGRYTGIFENDVDNLFPGDASQINEDGTTAYDPWPRRGAAYPPPVAAGAPGGGLWHPFSGDNGLRLIACTANAFGKPFLTHGRSIDQLADPFRTAGKTMKDIQLIAHWTIDTHPDRLNFATHGDGWQTLAHDNATSRLIQGSYIWILYPRGNAAIYHNGGLGNPPGQNIFGSLYRRVMVIGNILLSGGKLYAANGADNSGIFDSYFLDKNPLPNGPATSIAPYVINGGHGGVSNPRGDTVLRMSDGTPQTLAGVTAVTPGWVDLADAVYG